MKIIPRIHGSRAVSKHIGAATCRDSHVHTDQHTAANHAQSRARAPVSWSCFVFFFTESTIKHKHTFTEET